MIDQLKERFDSLIKVFEILYVIEGIKPVARIMVFEEQYKDIKNFLERYKLHIDNAKFKVLKTEKDHYSNKGEKINIKDITKRHDLNRVRARIIGTKGKTKELIENLSNCLISLHDNTVGIIGRAEEIKTCMQALISLIQGSKQSKVYSFLERKRAEEKKAEFEDLGLKEGKTKKKKE